MLMRTIAPSMLIIVIATLFFVIFRTIAVQHNATIYRQNREARVQAGFAAFEETLNEMDLEQRRLLSSTSLTTLAYMYDDIDWYSRYTLQIRLREGLSSLYGRFAHLIDSAYLYLPRTDRVISNNRVVAKAPPWLIGEAAPAERVYSVRQYSEDDEEVLAVCAVAFSGNKVLEALRSSCAESGDELTLLEGAEDASQWDMVLEGRLYTVGVNLREDVDSPHEYALQMGGILLGFLLLSLAINVVFILKWYREIYTPLRQLLIEAFGQTEAGNLKYRISADPLSPFYSVFNSYNHMMEKMEGYVENNLRQQILVSRANLKQLQSQINPHFLYNSYYILYRLIKRNDRESSMRLATHLAQFFQYVTRNAEDEKRLREEVAHARTYAEIQKMRFGDMLEIHIEEPEPPIAEIYVPRLILQPLLENAFKYVYDTQTDDKMILHIGYEVRSAHAFDILVENSGGVSDEVLEEIRTRLASTDEGMETTALINIHRRLKIFFGEDSGLSVSRSALGGLCVRMHIVEREEG